MPLPPALPFHPPAEGQLLAGQADSIKEYATQVAQLRLVGRGLGVYEFDRQLQAAA
jgi:ferritin heavy chain